jgi:hypothetical protein
MIAETHARVVEHIFGVGGFKLVGAHGQTAQEEEDRSGVAKNNGEANHQFILPNAMRVLKFNEKVRKRFNCNAEGVRAAPASAHAFGVAAKRFRQTYMRRA